VSFAEDGLSYVTKDNVPSFTTTERNLLTGLSNTNLVIYNKTTQNFERYDGTTWVQVLAQAQTYIAGYVRTQTELTALLASTTGTGLYVVLFASPTGITGLAQGDIINHVVDAGPPQTITNTIYYTYANAPNRVYLNNLLSFYKSVSNWRADGVLTIGNAAYTCTGAESVIALTTDLTANRTVTLPSPALYQAGETLTVQDQTGALYVQKGTTWRTLALSLPSGATFNGVLGFSLFIEKPYGKITLTSDGVSNWSYDPKESPYTYCQWGGMDGDPTTGTNVIGANWTRSGANSSYVSNDTNYIGSYIRLLTGVSQLGSVNFNVTRSVSKAEFCLDFFHYNNGTRQTIAYFFTTSTPSVSSDANALGGYEFQIAMGITTAAFRLLHNGVVINSWTNLGGYVWTNVEFTRFRINFNKGLWQFWAGDYQVKFLGSYYDSAWATRTLSGSNHGIYSWADSGGASATAIQSVLFKSYISEGL
jgi:hypothetical protein